MKSVILTLVTIFVGVSASAQSAKTTEKMAGLEVEVQKFSELTVTSVYKVARENRGMMLVFGGCAILKRDVLVFQGFANSWYGGYPVVGPAFKVYRDVKVTSDSMYAPCPEGMTVVIADRDEPNPFVNMLRYVGEEKL